MKKLLPILAAGAILAPLAVQAEVNYSYLDGLYIHSDLDDFDDSADGFGVRGSLGLGRNLHLVGSWIGREFTVGPTDIDIERSTFGLGAHFALTPDADVIIEAEYLNQDFDNLGDEDGYQITGGFRTMMTETFEIDGGVRFVELDDTTAIGYIRGIYSFNETWGAFGEFELGEDEDSLLIGVRLNF